MKTGMVSIVVPIYKTEKFLNRCIDSLVHQTYQNIEILLIDDGSPDNAPKLCEEWTRKDNRIRVIHKQNEGLGMARNTGIDNSQGEYICFFDSDDYVALNTVEKAYQCAKENHAEVVCFGWHSVRADGTIRETAVPTPTKTVFKGREVQENLLPNLISPDNKSGESWNLQLSACMALFSMCLIQKENWRFVSEREIISEDNYSLIQLFGNVEVVCVLKEAKYFYCQNEESLTQTFRRDRYEKIKHYYNRTLELVSDIRYPESVKRRLPFVFISYTIAHLKQLAGSQLRTKEKIAELRNILSDNLFCTIVSQVDYTADSMSRKIFFTLAAKKMTYLCFLLLQLDIKK